jgi:hypothetical protein
MSNLVFMADPATGRVALFDEPVASGDFDDPNSARNAPLNNQVANLQRVRFGSDLDIMEVVSDTTIAVSHAAVAASSAGGVSGGALSGSSSSNLAATLGYGAGAANHLLVTHSLGYLPNCIAVVGSNVLFPGMPVQIQSGGRSRYCSLYVTTTQVRLAEWSTVSNAALAAASLNYRVLIFRAPRAPSGSILFEYDPVTGAVTMARGRIDSRRRYLQVVPGGSPFGIAYGKTIDLKNGAARMVNPDGSVFEPVQAGMRARLQMSFRTGSHVGAWGASMAYNGTFAGPEQIMVQAP